MTKQTKEDITNRDTHAGTYNIFIMHIAHTSLSTRIPVFEKDIQHSLKKVLPQKKEEPKSSISAILLLGKCLLIMYIVITRQYPHHSVSDPCFVPTPT